MSIISNAVDGAKKLKVSKGLQQIVMAYTSFSLKGMIKEVNTCKNAAEWAGVLAKHEEMNVASIFVVADDYLVETEHHPIQKTIGLVKNGQWGSNPSLRHISFYESRAQDKQKLIP
jgi:hypothetical protein